MNKTTKGWLIAAAFLVGIGCVLFGGVLTMKNWDFTKISTVKYDTVEYIITEPYENLCVTAKTADVSFEVWEKDTSAVVCREQTNMKHTVTVENGTLTVAVNDTRKWYEYLGVNFATPKITVCLPQSLYGDCSVKTDTGNINMNALSVATLDLSVTTGKVSLSQITCKKDISLSVSTGKATLTDITCKDLASDGNTGAITLKNVIAAEHIFIERSTGDVNFDGCDGGDLVVTTDTGSVRGSLRTSKVFDADTDTGKVRVPNTTEGGTCRIRTNTGDIRITVG